MRDCTIDDAQNGSQVNTTIVGAHGLSSNVELTNVVISTDINRNRAIVRSEGAFVTVTNGLTNARADSLFESTVLGNIRGAILLENHTVNSVNSSGTIFDANGGNITVRDSGVTAAFNTNKVGDIRVGGAGQSGTLALERVSIDARSVIDVPIAISGASSVLIMESSALVFSVGSNLPPRREMAIDATGGGRVFLTHNTFRNHQFTFGFNAFAIVGPNTGNSMQLLASNNLFVDPGSASGVFAFGSAGAGAVTIFGSPVNMTWTPTFGGTEQLPGTRVAPNPATLVFQADLFHLAANLAPRAASLPSSSLLDIDGATRSAQPNFGCDEF